MKPSTFRFLAIGCSLVLLAGMTTARGDDKDKEKKKEPAQKAPPTVPQRGGPGNPGGGGGQSGPGQPTAPTGGPGVKPSGSRPSGPDVGGKKPTGPDTDGRKPAGPDTDAKKPTGTDIGGKKSTGPDIGGNKPTGHDTDGRMPTRPEISGKKPIGPDIDGKKPTSPDISGRQPTGPDSDGRKAGPKLFEEKKRDGTIERKTASGAVKERAKVDPKTGIEKTQHFSVTGKVRTQVEKKPNGEQLTTHYAASGKPQKTELVKADGSKAVTTRQVGRNGQERTTETVEYDGRSRPVSKTVQVNTTVNITRVTVVNRTVVKNYVYRPCGYVYRPHYVVVAPLYVSWYDPYWYSPAGVVIVHPFHYDWGWHHSWYYHHRYYWDVYPVYAAPSYWITDWMVASYVAERYEASASAAQAREEARLAREEAAKASQAAEKARDEQEKAELREALAIAQKREAEAETRAVKAEAAEERAKAQAGRQNPNAAPIDKETKEMLRGQIEQTIAENKQAAEQAAKGGEPVPSDITKALANPKHVYVVSKTVSVSSAKDNSPAGTITEGDLLKVEPGQDLKGANETTFVTMRVMTTKGEEGQVPAGTLISLPVRDLQDFDSEFRAKLDQGVAAADANKDLFKKGLVQQ